MTTSPFKPDRSKSFVTGVLLTLLLAACTESPRENSEAEQALRDSLRHAEYRSEQVRQARQREVMTLEAAAPGYGYPGPPPTWMPSEALNRENYAHFNDNPVRAAAEHPVSTFSVDVDTGSYANVRRWLNQGSLPPMDAVRVEEMINYFDYDYATPASREHPFNVTTALAQAPWNEDALLLRIGIKGYDIARDERPAANLVFLVDVSGSMSPPERLPLLQKSLGMLVDQLEARDRVSIVVYAAATGVVLPPTPGNEKATIRAALNQLVAGGSTNGGAGIQLAYEMAEQGFIKDGINRVMLATDGDFNVGTVNFEELVNLVERKRENGVTLTTLGFGAGNYNGRLMEQLANKGNGNYAYIDTLKEANKVLVKEMSSTLFTIAQDVKAQIEFNPAIVAEYRLIGYENRVLEREDFNNDRVDAGDIGAGHTVTALYEIVLQDSAARRVDPLRYAEQARKRAQGPDELAFLKLRYKLPGETDSRLIETPVLPHSHALAETDPDFRFASAVAAFGQKLRGGKYLDKFGYEDIRQLAANARGNDSNGYRGEFLQLLDLVATLDTSAAR